MFLSSADFFSKFTRITTGVSNSLDPGQPDVLFKQQANLDFRSSGFKQLCA